MIRLLLVLIGAAASALLSLAAPADPGAGTGARYLGRYDLAQVQKVSLGDVAEAPGTRHWDVVEWKSEPKMLLVLSFLAPVAGHPVQEMDPRLALLVDAGAAGLSLAASAKAALSDSNCEDTSGGAPSDQLPALKLDRTPYRIDEGQIVAGLRLTCTNAFPAGEGSETRLWLFRKRDNTLDEILSTPVAWMNADRPANDLQESHASVGIEKVRHGGVRDLVIRETIKRGPLVTPDRKASRHTESHRFTWNGTRYQAADAAHAP